MSLQATLKILSFVCLSWLGLSTHAFRIEVDNKYFKQTETGNASIVQRGPRLFLLTAKHVLKDGSTTIRFSRHQILGRAPLRRKILLAGRKVHDDGDLALVELHAVEVYAKAPILLLGPAPKVGDRLTISGVSGAAFELRSEVLEVIPFVAPIGIFDAPVRANKYFRFRVRPLGYEQTGGLSGAAIVNARGEAVGVWCISNSNGFGWAHAITVAP